MVGGFIPQCIWHWRKKNKADKGNLNGPNVGLQINQYRIWKKINEFEEDDDETIVILTEHQGLKTRLKNNKAF